MRKAIIFTILAVAAATPVLAQTSIAGVTTSGVQPAGGKGQATTAARITAGGGQQPHAVVVTGQNSPVSSTSNVGLKPAGNLVTQPNTPAVSVAAGAAATQGSKLEPLGFANGQAGKTGAVRSVDINPNLPR